MATTFQLTVDCRDPAVLTHFWAAALGYRIEDPPSGFGSWNEYWRGVGVPDEELPDDHDAADSVVDPAGVGPRVWFQPVPEPKTVKNRLHLDLKVGGGRTVPLETRKQRVDAEAERLAALGATEVRVLSQHGVDHYAVVMQDPEGNEFCIT